MAGGKALAYVCAVVVTELAQAGTAAQHCSSCQGHIGKAPLLTGLGVSYMAGAGNLLLNEMPADWTSAEPQH